MSDITSEPMPEPVAIVHSTPVEEAVNEMDEEALLSFIDNAVHRVVEGGQG